MALGDVKNSDSPDDDPGPFFSRGHADARDRGRMICRDSAFDRFGASVRIPKLRLNCAVSGHTTTPAGAAQFDPGRSVSAHRKVPKADA